MKGSIRTIAGLLVVFGVAGAIDTATDAQLITLIGIAIAGLALMASGTSAMKTA